MSYPGIKNNEAVLRRLMSGNLSHAYIISGSDSDGRLSFARAVAAGRLCEGVEKPCTQCRHCKKALRCIHPDIILVDKPEDKTEISVSAIRSLCADSAVMPNEAAQKVYIINNAECMNASSQNAFLKTLEEPPSFVSFLLLTDNPRLLLGTIRSRCTELVLPPVMAEPRAQAVSFVDMAFSPDKSEFISFLFSMDKMNKAEIPGFFADVKRAAMAQIRSSPHRTDDMMRMISLAGTAEEYLSVNVSVSHIAGLFLAEFT